MVASSVNSIVSLTGYCCVEGSFPKEIPLNEKDSLCLETFKSSIEKAQKLRIPFYLLAVTEMKPQKEGKLFFQVYDGCYLRHYLSYKGIDAKDPLTNLPIKKIHYFAIQCFKVCSDEVSEVDLNNDVVASYLQLPREGVLVEQALFNSVNYLKLEEATNKELIQRPASLMESVGHINLVRKSQNYLFELDKSQWIFTQKSFGSKQNITTIWSFCYKKIYSELKTIIDLDDDILEDDELSDEDTFPDATQNRPHIVHKEISSS
ncbi:MAG: hypothetical protein WB791_00165 [Waddliaceae bacterium]